MAHWRFRFDSDHIGHWDLRGRDVTVEIAKVATERIKQQGGSKQKLVLYFKKKRKGYITNRTVCKTIERMYGDDDTKWPGCLITIYPTTTMAPEGKKRVRVGCIRIRDRRPDGMPNSQPDIDEGPEPPPDAEEVESLVDDEWKDSGPPGEEGVPG